jgi:hypothetical protein
VSPDTSWEEYRVDRDPMETEDLDGDDDCTETRSALEKWYAASNVPAGAAAALVGDPHIATPIADLGTSVRLLAVDAPKQVKAGTASIDVTWTFEALDRVANGWKVFVHVGNAANRNISNGDHAPTRPFEWWKKGDFIRYTTKVAIPPGPGHYDLYAGLWRSSDNQRAQATASTAHVERDEVTVATIEVTP